MQKDYSRIEVDPVALEEVMLNMGADLDVDKAFHRLFGVSNSECFQRVHFSLGALFVAQPCTGLGGRGRSARHLGRKSGGAVVHTSV